MWLGWGSSAHIISFRQDKGPDVLKTIRTFRLPPVRVTFTNRRVYVILFFARPLGVFFFS